MRIKTDILKKSLELVNKVATKELGVLCKIENNILTLYANNGEVKIVKTVEITDSENREFVLDNTSISILNSLPEGEADFRFEEGKVNVKVARVKNTISLPESNIKIENDNDDDLISEFSVDTEVLLRINQVSYACATDDSRPILQGVYFNCEVGKVIGLDGYRIATQQLPEIICTTQKEESLNFVLKGDKLSILKYFYGQVEVRNKKRWVEFFSKEQGISINIAKLEGEFVNTDAFAQLRGSNEVIFSTSELIGAFTRLKIACPENLTLISIKDKIVKVISKNKSVVAEQQIERATVKFDGELDICLNTMYLLECMQTYKHCENVVIKFNSTNEKPIFVEIEGANTLILPVRSVN